MPHLLLPLIRTLDPPPLLAGVANATSTTKAAPAAMYLYLPAAAHCGCLLPSVPRLGLGLGLRLGLRLGVALKLGLGL